MQCVSRGVARAKIVLEYHCGISCPGRREYALFAADAFGKNPWPNRQAARQPRFKTKDGGPELLPSETVKQMAGWVLDSRDNGGLPFVIIDKPAAKAFVYSKDGQLLGAAWVLVGLATGDDSLPGIGTMPLAAIKPEMRTTPAGRFVASFGHDLNTDVLWVDYGLAVSLHRVINTEPAERRLQRIVSPKPGDHRISFGCINVPAKFFDAVVVPTFGQEKGIVYILPDVKPLQAVFPTFYDAKAPAAGSKSQPGPAQALTAPDGLN